MKQKKKTSWIDIAEHNRKNTDIRYSKVPFGKYQGYFLKEVPIEYIKWAVSNITDQARALYFAEELLRREPTTYKKK